MDKFPMALAAVRLRRNFKAVSRNIHGLWQVLKAVASTDHPLLAHLIPIRRCNLACTYCNEFDDFSKPVPAEQMLRRWEVLCELPHYWVTITRVGTFSRSSHCVVCPHSARNSCFLGWDPEPLSPYRSSDPPRH